VSVLNPGRLPPVRFRVATNGMRFRLERLTRRWFGRFGPMVWRRTPDRHGEGHHYLTHEQAAAALRALVAGNGETWTDDRTMNRSAAESSVVQLTVSTRRSE
jgi:hypothetical protein